MFLDLANLSAIIIALPTIQDNIGVILRTDAESIGHPQPMSQKKLLRSVQEGLVRFDALGFSLLNVTVGEFGLYGISATPAR
jgi:hypothetical protein